jgi:hypothetical protein
VVVLSAAGRRRSRAQAAFAHPTDCASLGVQDLLRANTAAISSYGFYVLNEMDGWIRQSAAGRLRTNGDLR